MKEKYEQLHILLLIAWLVTRGSEGYLIIFPFLGVVSLIAHIVVTQIWYSKHEANKNSSVRTEYTGLKIFHYVTLAFIYICITIHFSWRFINAI